MAKVILKPLASPDSPIYNQPISIGVRFTQPLPKHPLEGVDLQNLPFDPAVEAGKSSLEKTKSNGKKQSHEGVIGDDIQMLVKPFRVDSYHLD